MPIVLFAATVSLGRSSAGHTILHKIEQAANKTLKGLKFFTNAYSIMISLFLEA